MKVFFFVFIQFAATIAYSQKEDYVWLLSGGSNVYDTLYTLSTLGFNTGQAVFTNTLNQYPDMQAPTNTSVCDGNGNLLCYTNGVDLFNADHELVENGDAFHSPTSFPTGFTAIQGGILIPLPGHPGSYVLISCNDVPFYYNNIYNVGCSPTTYSVIDMNENGGQGKVLEKNIAINFDTLQLGKYLSVLHGNGRDYWALGAPTEGSNKYFKYLIDPTGVKLQATQEIGNTITPGNGQGAISPDGEHIGYYQWFGVLPTSTNVGIDLYGFDRCSGELSNPIHILYPDVAAPGGIAFSPNSRFVYTPSWDKVYQFDLWAADIPASRVTVAEYDGFLDERGLPTRFYQPKLAPDGKIYITVSNYNSRYLHIIDQPDSLGIACNVLQHQILMPSYHFVYMPNHPVTRLGKVEGCDTIASSTAMPLRRTTSLQLYPNPTAGPATVAYELPTGMVAELRVVDALGRVLKVQQGITGKGSMDLEALPPGVYLACLVANGEAVRVEKLVVR